MRDVPAHEPGQRADEPAPRLADLAHGTAQHDVRAEAPVQQTRLQAACVEEGLEGLVAWRQGAEGAQAGQQDGGLGLQAGGGGVEDVLGVEEGEGSGEGEEGGGCED